MDYCVITFALIYVMHDYCAITFGQRRGNINLSLILLSSYVFMSSLMRNKSKYVNNTQRAHNGQTTSQKWAFVSVLLAYFAEILNNGFFFQSYSNKNC